MKLNTVKILLLLSAGLFLIMLGGCGMNTSGAIYGAKGDLEDRDYLSALNNLTDANFSGLTRVQEIEVTFLRAQALYGLKRKTEARAVLGYIIDNYSDSEFYPQAKALLKKWSKKRRNAS